MDLSVVIPVHNEAGNVVPLLGEIRAALDGRLTFEVVFVDDGSRDSTVSELEETPLGQAEGSFQGLVIVRHDRAYGQSAAVHSGVKLARGLWVATLDGDGQNDPADIPALLDMRDQSTDPDLKLFAGHRVKRQDSWNKKISSRIANNVRSRLLGDATPDTGCGLKLFERAAFLELPYFKHMHRFLPALMHRQRYRIQSVPVNHRHRQHGTSKYGMFNRLWVGLFDLVGVMWLQRRANVPRYLDQSGEKPESRV